MSSKISKSKKLAVYSKTLGGCSVCGKQLSLNFASEIEYMHIDHLIPRNKGGDNSINNLFPICKSCNSSKRDFTVYELREQILKLRADVDRIILKKENIIAYIKRGIYEYAT